MRDRAGAGALWLSLLLLWCGAGLGAGATEYWCGAATGAEQYLLELINRARRNPAAEAARYGIDLNAGLDPGTITTDPKQPLAHHPCLLESARAHSQWMLDTDIFSHTGAGESTSRSRMEAAGYVFTGASGSGENIAWAGHCIDYPFQRYAEEIHANLFTSATHRKLMLDPAMREVGTAANLGLFTDSGTDYYAMMTTEDFAYSSWSPGPFIVGVAHYDYDGDGCYDIGEGIAGVTVSPAGVDRFAVTNDAGGYAVPVPGPGTYAVAFHVPNLAPMTLEVTVADGHNTKCDLTLAYAPPSLAGIASARVGRATPYSISPVGGATGYRVRSGVLGPDPPVEGAETGTTDVIITQTTTYAVIQNTVRYAGSSAFHLAHPDLGVPSGPANQRIRLRRSVVPSPGATLTFQSRLRYATSYQAARAEVSLDAGATWQEEPLWEQRGTGGAGETAFASRVVSLDPFAGHEIMVRFSYDYVPEGSSPSYYPQTAAEVGWYIDEIAFAGCREILSPVVTSIDPGAPHFFFQPTSTAAHALAVLPVVSGMERPAGPVRELVPLANDYAGWRAAREEETGLAPGTLSDPLDDPDGDGAPNLLEYALEDQGADPTRPDAGAVPGAAVSGGLLCLDYSIDVAKPDLEVVPVASPDLATWRAPGETGAPAGFSDGINPEQSGTGTIEYRRASVPVDAGARVFLRLRARIVGAP